MDLPERVQALSPVRGQAVEEVAARQDCGMALTTQWEVFTWGGWPAPAWVPQATKALHEIRVARISAGTWHMAAISEAGELFTWGDDDGSGCLGHGDSSRHNCVEFTRVEALAGTNIASVSAGDNLTLAIAQDGTVYTFGRIEEQGQGMLPHAPSLAPSGTSSVPLLITGLRLQ
jgi:alpha-tubulin suppressor-like RCC1 family protein